MAALHRAAFPDAAWDAAAFAGLVAMPGAVALSADDGFLLGRIVAGEAEILTLAVHPRARRRGIATGLLARFEAAASRAGGARVFLEVAADNAAARALYGARGYGAVGHRPGYYAGPGGVSRDALVLARALQPGAPDRPRTGPAAPPAHPPPDRGGASENG
jgi:ribosomal-protein-alanine N-acetyltransferase